MLLLWTLQKNIQGHSRNKRRKVEIKQEQKQEIKVTEKGTSLVQSWYPILKHISVVLSKGICCVNQIDLSDMTNETDAVHLKSVKQTHKPAWISASYSKIWWEIDYMFIPLY